MTTSHKSAGGGTSSGNAVQSGSETNSVPLAGAGASAIPRPALVDADEFDEHVGALQELRVLAEAGTALAMHGGNHITSNDFAVLFSTIALRCELASKDLDTSIEYLVQLGTAQQGALQ